MKKSIAIIPARGGSKRIPGKNIRRFLGKPMIGWPIETAIRSGLFERIIVSTDDDAIAEIAQSHGAEVPFIRPDSLADDYTGTTAVVAHAVNWLSEEGVHFDYVCSIYPTAPFLSVTDLRLGFESLLEGSWKYVFSACEYAAPIWRSFRVDEKGAAEMFFPEKYYERSQDLPAALHDAGQFYWARKETWLAELIVLAEHSKAQVLPRQRVIDIDTENDWEFAEILGASLESTKT